MAPAEKCGSHLCCSLTPTFPEKVINQNRKTWQMLCIPRSWWTPPTTPTGLWVFISLPNVRSVSHNDSVCGKVSLSLTGWWPWKTADICGTTCTCNKGPCTLKLPVCTRTHAYLRRHVSTRVDRAAAKTSLGGSGRCLVGSRRDAASCPWLCYIFHQSC